MKEKMNQNIENTLKRIYVAVLRKFREKTGGNFDEEVKKKQLRRVERSAERFFGRLTGTRKKWT